MAGFGSLIAGFVKGASDYGVDQIKRRQDAEQEIEKAKLLERLRLEGTRNFPRTAYCK